MSETLEQAKDRLSEDSSSEETSTMVDGPVESPTVEGETTEAGAEATESPVNLASMEALLFSTHHPLTAGRLAELLDLESTKPLRKAIRALNEQYESTGRSFRVEQVAGGFQMLTLPAFADIIKKHQQKEADAKLTKAALETLAIIAYKQPILRANIEAIRGCACGETVRSLMEKHLVKIAGRAEEPGRPILYGTTKRFLEVFGLNSLKDLPKGDEGLRAPPAPVEAPVAEAPVIEAPVVEAPSAQPTADESNPEESAAA